ncbi:MAG: hypothetical protein CSB24_03580 [Deltaproteobacteria bacterium]|nr:MAG: hypothetical protein CSB24_03580 [Deltaproteobacteria bacterium]
MKVLRLLLVHAVKDIYRYKSFLVLILLVMLIDRIGSHYSPKLSAVIERPRIWARMADVSEYLYGELPGQLGRLFSHYELFVILGGGFCLKTLLSLWPSSDMRRMHREERTGFGLIGSLLQLRWKQVGWDLVAVLLVCAISLLVLLVSYACGLAIHKGGNPQYSGFVVIACAAALWPLLMAGFSYSSKIAVISAGSFVAKTRVFLLLFTRWAIFFPSWLFYGFRIYLELFVIAIVPLFLNEYISNWGVRILLVSSIVCPVYSLLKMVSFKVFLYLFRQEPLVREEYRNYYQAEGL